MTLNQILTPELYAQVQAAIDQHNAAETDKAKQVRFVDLSEGGYVSADKYRDKTTGLAQQITELQGQITQRDADIAGLNEKLTAAQTDAATKLSDTQAALKALQDQYATDRTGWETKVQRQQHDFLIRERAGSIPFTSAAARRDFLREAGEKGFTIDGENILGFDDFVTKYRADNPGAIVEEKPKPEPPQPRIVAPNKPEAPSHGKTLSEMMKAKNENPNMIVSFDK